MTTTSLPARYERPAVLAEFGWVLSWSVMDPDPALSDEQITALQRRVEAELLAPAGVKAAAVALDRVAPGKRQRGNDWSEVARNYLEVLSEIPADLLALAIGRTLREWCSPELPPPGFIRTRISGELAERELVAMKLRTMLIKRGKDRGETERWEKIIAEDRRRFEERERIAKKLAASMTDAPAAEDRKRAAEELTRRRQEAEQKIEQAWEDAPEALGRAAEPGAAARAAIRASAERLGIPLRSDDDAATEPAPASEPETVP